MSQDLNKPLFQATLADLKAAIKDVLNEHKEVGATTTPTSTNGITLYNNETLKELLGVQDKLIKKYRDDGLLPFHKVGDKFWYTQEDVDLFLSRNFFEAYAYQ